MAVHEPIDPRVRLAIAQWPGSSAGQGWRHAEPRKRPSSSWLRFVYPAPNACCQLDATECVLTRGRKCVIFQLIDDHSRYAVASHVAAGETAKDAITSFDKAVAAHGVPQRLPSDNEAALTPSRRGLVDQLVSQVAALGRGDHRQAHSGTSVRELIRTNK